MLSFGEDVLIGAALVLLVVRQFVWRGADPHSILRLPLIVLGVGCGWLIWEIANGEQVTLAAAGVFAVEIALVGVTGTIMGRTTRMETADGALRYKLTSWGVLLWAVFLAVRIGSFVLAARLGTHLLETTAAIMISFGVNRLASSLVVRKRMLG